MWIQRWRRPGRPVPRAEQSPSSALRFVAGRRTDGGVGTYAGRVQLAPCFADSFSTSLRRSRQDPALQLSHWNRYPPLCASMIGPWVAGEEGERVGRLWPAR
jgi:hypothetical protein